MNKHVHKAMALMGAVLLTLTACQSSAEGSKEKSPASPSHLATHTDLSAAPSDVQSKDTEAKKGEKGYKQPEDLKGQKLSVQAGTTGEDYAIELSGRDAVSSFEKYIDAILELRQGKVEACVMDGEPAKLIVAGNPDLVILEKPLGVENYAIAVKKGNGELLQKVNAVIKEEKEAGRIEASVSAYIQDEESAAASLDFNEGGEGQLKVGTEAGFAPYETYVGDKIAGSDIQLAATLAKAMNKQLQVEDMAFDSLLMALQNGQVDLVIAGMTVNEERSKVVDFSEPYFEAKQVVVIRKDDLAH